MLAVQHFQLVIDVADGSVIHWFIQYVSMHAHTHTDRDCNWQISDNLEQLIDVQTAQFVCRLWALKARSTPRCKLGWPCERHHLHRHDNTDNDKIHRRIQKMLFGIRDALKLMKNTQQQTFNSLKTYWLGIRFTAKFIHPLSRVVILFYIINWSSLH